MLGFWQIVSLTLTMVHHQAIVYLVYVASNYQALDQDDANRYKTFLPFLNKQYQTN